MCLVVVMSPTGDCALNSKEGKVCGNCPWGQSTGASVPDGTRKALWAGGVCGNDGLTEGISLTLPSLPGQSRVILDLKPLLLWTLSQSARVPTPTHPPLTERPCSSPDTPVWEAFVSPSGRGRAPLYPPGIPGQMEGSVLPAYVILCSVKLMTRCLPLCV